MTHYEALGVSRNADREVVSAAYRALAKKYHPDVNASPNANEQLSKLNEAYAILSNEDSRREYDLSLRDTTNETYEPTRRVGSKDFENSEVAPWAAEVAKQSLIGDFLFLVVGVPLFWMLSVFLAEVLIFWLLRLLLDWAGTEAMTLGRAMSELVNIASLRFNVWTAADDEIVHNTSVGFTVFASFFDLFLAAVATGSVLSYAADERPRIPRSLVGISIFVLLNFLGYRQLGAMSGAEGPDAAMFAIATYAAMFTGIVFGLREDAKARKARKLSSEFGETAIA